MFNLNLTLKMAREATNIIIIDIGTVSALRQMREDAVECHHRFFFLPYTGRKSVLLMV